jgi:predicted lipid-binding transport protein (Tim44 family)
MNPEEKSPAQAPQAAQPRAAPSLYSSLILGLLGMLAALLIATAFGLNVPRWSFSVLILAQAALRVARDWAGSRRNSSLFNALVSALLAYLIATST